MKYIIDIPDKAIDFMGGSDHVSVFVEPVFKTGDCKRYALRLSKEDIEPCTEPSRKAVDLQYASDIENVARKNYKEGAKDAWEFVMKCLKMDGNDFYEIFNSCDALCLTNLSYQEAKAKYESWEKFKDEIRIGDEIKIKTSYSADAVVIGMDDYDLFIVWKDGETDRIEPPERKQWVKTGKHFPEVEELLKKITGESNED